MNGTVIALLSLTLAGIMISLITEYIILEKTEEKEDRIVRICDIGDTVYIVNFCPKEKTDEIFDIPLSSEEWRIDRYAVLSEHSRHIASELIANGVAFFDEEDAMAYLQRAKAEYENMRGKGTSNDTYCDYV